MKVITYQPTCISAGQCALSAPNVFWNRESDGKVELWTDSPPESEYDQVREAAALCPSASITIEEDD
ncbi:ferredoxin [Rathayibacter soli]|uniref:ferredoxin n=1 Tax=Rathayibacter soli TaxID=3144168 RepID=UPI0027E449C0|nr:ferredoxin [Glaciibacter superstes]